MGSVHLARVVGSDEPPVAVKVLHPHLARDPAIVAMFVDEARVATRIDHPNVVAVSDVSLVGDDLVIVMDYVEGAPLHWLQRDLAERGRQMEIGLAVSIVADALEGLHAAHELTDPGGASAGLVHRDVSPQNILVGVDGVARVTDFGVAMSAGRLAKTAPDAPVKGKVQYLAPEQVRRRGALDRRVDVFAAGILLWECLTGRTLFGGGTEAEAIARVLREPIDPPSVHRPEVPPALDDVCLRALERDVDRRFPTALAFAEALRQAAPSMTRADVGATVMEVSGDPIREKREALRRDLETPHGAPEVEGAAARDSSLSDAASRTRFYAVSAAAIVLAITVLALVLLLLRKKPEENVSLEIVEVPVSATATDVSPTPSASVVIAAGEASGTIDAGARVSPSRPRRGSKDGKPLFMPGHL